MNAARLDLALLLMFLCLPVAAHSADQTENVLVSASRVYSLPQYSAELDRLSLLADRTTQDHSAAATALEDLRGGWKVEAEGHTFAVNTDWIVNQFEKLRKNPEDAAAREQLLQRIAALKNDTQAFQQMPPDAAASRTTLNQILARKEFHQVHGPNWLDQLKYRIEEWLVRLLSRFFSSSSVPVIGRSIVWILVAAAVSVLAWVVYREIRRNAHLETIMPEVLPVSAKQWNVWMSEARAAAAQGLWRDAVHLAYWAGISFLEESGTWRPDKARTPREYLRLISPNSEVRPALSTLTRQLEVTWYGNQPAGPETFAETLTHLEDMGCRQL